MCPSNTKLSSLSIIPLDTRLTPTVYVAGSCRLMSFDTLDIPHYTVPYLDLVGGGMLPLPFDIRCGAARPALDVTA